MHQGRIIEYIEQGRFICAICLQDKGTRLHLLTSSNREVNLAPKRAISVSSTAVDAARPREDLLEYLRRAEHIRNELKSRVDVPETWELVKDDPQYYDHRYLAQLCFGEVTSDDHCSALLRALFEDRLHFKLKDTQFVPNSEERVEQIRVQREEEKKREEKLQQGSAWLRDVVEGRKTEAPLCKEDVVQLLVQLALYGDDAPEFKHGKELLTRAGIGHIRDARNLLIRMGIWGEDENLDLHRMDIPRAFGTDVMEEARRLSRREASPRGREDFRHLHVITIDGPMTRDFDDAVSLETVGDERHLGIHIADVAAAIPPGSALDREARSRASSLYLPRQMIPMLPPDLSQETLSLKLGCDREAVSLIARFDKEGNLLGYRFYPSIIRVETRLTYDEVNESMGKVRELDILHTLSRLLRGRRKERGALNLTLPDVVVRFSDNGALSLHLLGQDTPSRSLVAEFMILYNSMAAQFCLDNEIPILFRNQKEPNERIPSDGMDPTYYVFQQRRRLQPLRIETEPGTHSSLGLDLYTHATSPIRRYLDLILQRQLSHFLMGKPPVYEREALEEIRMFVAPALKNLARVKINRMRYWTLKFLRQQVGKSFPALVLDVLNTKCRIVLTDVLLLCEIKRKESVSLSPGQTVKVRVTKSDPWEDLLELELTQG